MKYLYATWIFPKEPQGKDIMAPPKKITAIVVSSLFQTVA